ncbi:MAG TPA: HAD family acid phosphatase [Pseudolabrys sp.]|nr:HAD family acid phosphatase [Pseudolabrys sp.]
MMVRTLRSLLAATALIGLLAAGATAADCPAVPEPHLPKPEAPLNVQLVKDQLRAYHDGDYMADMAAVYAVARSYVVQRAAQVKKPAVVLDIDETSLSNWPNLKADDFGFIGKGPCTLEKGYACGFPAWIMKGRAPAIEPALAFYNAVRARQVAVFFITGRTPDQREATIRNLRRAGFDGWAGLTMRPESDKAANKSVIPYKSGERAKIEKRGYTILAAIGDQLSDSDGGSTECKFKLPNPFYFIP